jgi:hypothetical protein
MPTLLTEDWEPVRESPLQTSFSFSLLPSHVVLHLTLLDLFVCHSQLERAPTSRNGALAHQFVLNRALSA